MEKELNISAILKDKPKGTKLYDLLYNVDVELDTISTTDTETVVWCTNETDNNTTCHRGYSEFGTIRGCPDGLQILLPSKEMHDWRKFDWKNGVVLVSNDGDSRIIFKGFSKDDYTIFEGKHWISVSKKRYISRLDIQNTQDYHIEDDKDAVQTYINTIEERLGGKLNLQTLEIEKQPKQEFKDGDIVHIPEGYIAEEAIFIAKVEEKGVLHSYVYMSKDSMKPLAKSSFSVFGCLDSLRLATENEQQQLFSALAKEGKRWNPDTKQIEDFPKKCEFKPFDKVLVRDYLEDKWMPNFFSCYDGTSEYKYGCIAGNSDNVVFSKYCIPYNDETKHLLGTADEWKGGEG